MRLQRCAVRLKVSLLVYNVNVTLLVLQDFCRRYEVKFGERKSGDLSPKPIAIVGNSEAKARIFNKVID